MGLYNIAPGGELTGGQKRFGSEMQEADYGAMCMMACLAALLVRVWKRVRWCRDSSEAAATCKLVAASSTQEDCVANWAFPTDVHVSCPQRCF